MKTMKTTSLAFQVNFIAKVDEEDTKPEEIRKNCIDSEKEKINNITLEKGQLISNNQVDISNLDENEIKKKKSTDSIAKNKYSNNLDEGEVRYVEPKKPKINVLSKEETLKIFKKIEEDNKKKKRKKKDPEELDELEKELANIPDEEANANKYAAKEIDKSLYEKLKKNPEKSAQIIFENTVKKKQVISSTNSENLMINIASKPREKVNANIDFLKNQSINTKVRDKDKFEFPPCFKKFQSTIKSIEDIYQSVSDIRKVKLQDYKEKVERIYFENNPLFQKYFDMWKLVKDYDIETITHLYILKELYFLESVKICVDSSSYYDLKMKTKENESSNVSVHSKERAEYKKYREIDEEKLNKKRKREKEEKRSYLHRKKNRRRSDYSSNSMSSSISRSSSYSRSKKISKNRRRNYDKDYRNEKSKKDKFSKRDSSHYTKNKNNKYDFNISSPKYSKSTLANTNNFYKKTNNQNSNQTNTYIDKVFCGNLVMTNKNTNICKEISAKANKINRETETDTLITPNEKPHKISNLISLDVKDIDNKDLTVNDKAKNYEISYESEKKQFVDNKLSKEIPEVSKDKVNNKEFIGNRNQINSTKNGENKEKMIKKIKEKLATNNIHEKNLGSCQSMHLQSKSPSLDLSPENRKENNINELSKDEIINSKSKELFFDIADFIE